MPSPSDTLQFKSEVLTLSTLLVEASDWGPSSGCLKQNGQGKPWKCDGRGQGARTCVLLQFEQMSRWTASRLALLYVRGPARLGEDFPTLAKFNLLTVIGFCIHYSN